VAERIEFDPKIPALFDGFRRVFLKGHPDSTGLAVWP
jgi:hypothetical protein